MNYYYMAEERIEVMLSTVHRNSSCTLVSNNVFGIALCGGKKNFAMK